MKMMEPLKVFSLGILLIVGGIWVLHLDGLLTAGYVMGISSLMFGLLYAGIAFLP